MDIANLRKPYNSDTDVLLEEKILRKEPHIIFDEWLNVACNTPGVEEPNAMTIATVNKEGKPTARMVLLKGYGKDGFRFFTNCRSEKGKNIENNPNVALVFYWNKLNRSVRVEGVAEKLSSDDIDAYYCQRPRPSQIAAHVSEHQSSPITGRDVLINRFKVLEDKFKDVVSIPRPDFWNGYLVRPERIEFWQGQSTRMHDRILFSKKQELKDGWLRGEDDWFYQRLEP